MRQFTWVIGGFLSLSAGTLMGADLVKNIGGVNYTLIDYTYLGVPGRLYVPPTYSAGTPTPLTMFLHGIGESTGNGAGPDAQVNGNMSNLLVNAKSQNYLLYCPQSAGWWPELNKTVNAIGSISQQYSIDPNRIYVTGLSAGGNGTMNAMRNYSNLFAGYVPLAAAGGQYTSPADAAPAVGRPAWYFGGCNDMTFTLNMRDSVNNTLTAEGVPTAQQPVYPGNVTYTYTSPDGQVRYTQFANAGHDNSVWNNGAYATPGMYTWLLSQHNNATKLQPGKAINLSLAAPNAAPTGLVDSHTGGYWNINSGYQCACPAAGTAAIVQTQGFDSSGTRTTTNIEITKGFYGQGTTTLPANAPYDAAIASGYGMLYVWNINKAQLVVHGLIPGGLYNMDLFASVVPSGSSTYVGLYTAGGKSITIDAANNASISTLSSLTADPLGNLTLDVGLSGNSTYAYLNTMSVVAVPEPTACAFLLSVTGIVALRRPRVRRK